MSKFQEQLEKIRTQPGFIAALDQSGGSTPGALRLYGIGADAWTDDEGMRRLVHEMRTRLIKSPSFNGDRILGAILFEDTMDRTIDGKLTADYLWEDKHAVPFLKVDKGLAEEQDGVQLMKPIPGLDELLERAKERNVFGTKMRSVIKQAVPSGIEAVVAQQFEIGKQILNAGLVPIIEPEVDIHCPDKAEAEKLLKSALLAELGKLSPKQLVMLKLTLPEVDNFYSECIDHPNVLKVVALSGGYPRAEANERLARNHGMVASFSRALAEGLTAQQTDEEYDAMLNDSIQSIHDASST